MQFIRLRAPFRYISVLHGSLTQSFLLVLLFFEKAFHLSNCYVISLQHLHSRTKPDWGMCSKTFSCLFIWKAFNMSFLVHFVQDVIVKPHWSFDSSRRASSAHKRSSVWMYRMRFHTRNWFRLNMLIRESIKGKLA